MKKVFYITIFTFILAIGTNVLAEVPMPIMNQLNNQMFTPEATKPLQTLERDYKTNIEILNLQQKDSVKQNTENTVNVNSVDAQQEKGLKKLFKGFTVEW